MQTESNVKQIQESMKEISDINRQRRNGFYIYRAPANYFVKIAPVQNENLKEASSILDDINRKLAEGVNPKLNAYKIHEDFVLIFIKPTVSIH